MSVESGARIGVLLLPQFSFAELGHIIEPLFISNWLLGEQRFQWQLLAIEDGVVDATNGISIPAAPVPPETWSFDLIFVLASFEMKIFAEDERLKGWLRQAARDGTELCGIEGGTEALAAAGLLNGYRAAIHWDNLDGFQELYPEVDAYPDLYVIDDRRMSCAGGTAVVDLMFHWLRPRLGRNVFNQLQNHMMEPRTRAGSVRQIPHDIEALDNVDSAIQRAIELMRQYIEEPARISEIAARLGISVRQMERRFHHEMHVSPSKYYLHMRIARAHRLLQQTDMSIAEVATSAGFQTLEHFSRIYRRSYGCPPSKDRLQTTQAPSLPREQ